MLQDLYFDFVLRSKGLNFLNGANCYSFNVFPPRFFQHFALKIYKYEDDKVADLSPQNMFGNKLSARDGTKPDLNIGECRVLAALIQRQNHANPWMTWIHILSERI